MNDPRDSHPAPVIVATFSDLGEAEVIAAKLTSAGLDPVILDAVEGGIMPVDGGAGVQVAVPAHEADAARAALVETGDATDPAEPA